MFIVFLNCLQLHVLIMIRPAQVTVSTDIVMDPALALVMII